MEAADRGDVETVKVLLKAGANVHVVSRHKQTAFSLARARDLALSTALMLQKMGVKIDYSTVEPDEAAAQRYAEVVRLLRDAGARE